MLNQSVIDNWSTALVNIAVEEKKVKQFNEQINVLSEALKDSDDFVKILSAKLTAEEDKVDKDKIIDETFSKFGFDQHIVNAMKILANEASFEYMRPILKQVRKDLDGLEGTEYGVAWSTTPLTSAQLKKLEEQISKTLKTNVTLVNKIDDQLIGGVQVVVAKQLFDGSIKGQLDQLKFTLLDNKIN